MKILPHQQDPLLQKLQTEIEEYQLQTKNFLLLVSGGADSMGLLDMCRQLSLHHRMGSIRVLHINHQTRGEENHQEEQLIRDYCHEYHLPLDIEKFTSTSTTNFQLEARLFRYEMSKKLLDAYQLDYLVTAHHQDDFLETMLHRLFSGANLTNLKPFSFLDGQRLKPLWNVLKAEILDYNQRHHVPFLEDSSNQTSNYDRNWIRHQIIPQLNSRYKNRWEASLLQLASRSGDLQTDFQHLATRLKSTVIFEDENGFRIEFQQDQFYNRSFVWFFIKLILLEKFQLSIGYETAKEIFQLAYQHPKGEVLDVSGSVRVEKTHLGWKFSQRIEQPTKQWHVLTESVEKPPTFSKGEFVIFADAETVSLPLSVRYFQAGDRFQPLGLKVQVKLSDFFINRKINKDQRHLIPLVVDAHQQIIWIGGIEIADMIKLTTQTKQTVKLTLQELT